MSTPIGFWELGTLTAAADAAAAAWADARKSPNPSRTEQPPPPHAPHSRQVAVCNRYPTLTHDQQSVLWANSETSYMDALGYVPGEDL